MILRYNVFDGYDLRSMVNRYMERIVMIPESGCWVWTGVQKNGYGKVIVSKNKRSKEFAVHRIFYTLFKGAIPEGLHLDHLCRVKCCCNPEHLEAVTAKVNILRSGNPAAVNAQKSHCIRGHSFAEHGIAYMWKGALHRGCKKCRVIATQTYGAKFPERVSKHTELNKLRAKMKRLSNA